MTKNTPGRPESVDAALEAIKRGYSPLPILSRDKKPGIPAWTRGIPIEIPAPGEDGRVVADSEKWKEVEQYFLDQALGSDTRPPAANLGLLLGAPSHGLIDVDLDHPKTRRLKNHFLPPTPMKSGRAGRPASHYWYLAEPGTLQGYKKYTMPKKPDGKVGDVIVEYRSTGGQSVIPPSVHPTGEDYRWEGEPWGGDAGPLRVDGRKLQVQVATLALATVLLDRWPQQGSRHEAYLALAGGLLWYGDRDVHPFWERNVGVLIEALAEATMDDDGPEARKGETLKTTLERIRDGRQTTGFGRLMDFIGEDHVKQARILVAEVEAAAGYVSRQAPGMPDHSERDIKQELAQHASEIAALPLEERDPLDERLGSWQAVDLEPYLAGRVRPVEPSVFMREDGKCLMYPGRVNMLYGSSESAKSWIALFISLQILREGNQRVMYLDLEDDPANTLDRLRLMGAGTDDLSHGQFTYIRPEEPLAVMQRNRWGKVEVSPIGQANQELFDYEIEQKDPALIVVDGMTVLYGLHGLSTNDTTDTDVITGWLKKLTRNGRTTVIVIDHTSKGAERGSLPIGSQHKGSMVQGTLLQVWPVRQPMPGAVGEVEVIVLKDRPGQVRAFSQNAGGGKAQLAARVILNSKDPARTDIVVKEPEDPAVKAARGVIDVRQAAAAQAAQELREVMDLIVNRVFRGDSKVVLSMRQVADRLAQVDDVEPRFLDMRQKQNGTWYATLPAKAMKKLVEDRWLIADGATKNRTYHLSMDVEVPGQDIDIDPDDPVDMDAATPGSQSTDDAPLGPPMTIADDDPLD